MLGIACNLIQLNKCVLSYRNSDLVWERASRWKGCKTKVLFLSSEKFQMDRPTLEFVSEVQA